MPPNYMQPILNWTPPDSPGTLLNSLLIRADIRIFERALALWYGCLRLADYAPPDREVPMDFRAPVKNTLVFSADPTFRGN